MLTAALKVIDGEPDDERAGIWHVACADVHPSDFMTMDQHGALYWCWHKRYDHYDEYFRNAAPR